MHFSLSGFIYQKLIDPLLSSIRQSISMMVNPEDTVIDIACGTGSLSVELSKHARHVTGIDLSDGMIVIAKRTANKLNICNISFEVMDAGSLCIFPDGKFDVAVTTMSMHQFDPALAIKVLREMKRVARRVIIADYNCPMSHGAGASLALGIERFAGGEHYRNFRTYMQRGGIKELTAESGLWITTTEVRGNGIFVVAQALPALQS
jgi:2-polyprenyl-3-methyl-5-hydroxy-6-metoxy-1,4-benzoquinol methylase